MKHRFGAAFRVFTIMLFLVAIFTAYQNVFSDDTAVRARAGDLARKEAGCGDKCKLTNMRGSRGMIDTSIEYDFAGAGGFLVTCRRAYVIAGDYTCAASKR